ncbi:MAG: dihydrodipicolinate synthase family protein [Lentisphaerae bacterium]|nr:dihydrodipicolinate synthase family protein [Lentisphaerota bacterium]
MDRERIKQSLASPVPSIRTPFDAEGNIDFAALGAMVEFCIGGGSQALILTAGDSLYPLLTESEISRVTKAVVELARGRAVVAACTGWWNTDKCVEFARYCRDVGVDILMTLTANWYPECLSVQTMVEHFAEVARHIPVMANTGCLHYPGKSVGLAVARRLVKEVDNIIAAKCDVQGEFDRKVVLLAKDKWTLFAGGTKQFHLELHPYGCQGHMSTFMTFKPEIAQRYWKAIRQNDLGAAAEVIARYDHPFFDFIHSLPGGFDAGMHGVYELYGLARRWRRKPFVSLADQDLRKLREFLVGLQIL